MSINRGFTLIEVLIALAVIGLLSAIAIPGYMGYVQSTRENVARTNMATLRLAEEAYFFEMDTYFPGHYVPSFANTLTGPLGWSPDLDGSQFVYTVSAGACGDIASCFQINVVGFGGKVNITAPPW